MFLEIRDQTWRAVEQDQMVDPGAIFRPVLHVLLILHLVGGLFLQIQLPIKLVFDRYIQVHLVGVHPF